MGFCSSPLYLLAFTLGMFPEPWGDIYIYILSEAKLSIFYLFSRFSAAMSLCIYHHSLKREAYQIKAESIIFPWISILIFRKKFNAMSI